MEHAAFFLLVRLLQSNKSVCILLRVYTELITVDITIRLRLSRSWSAASHVLHLL